MTKLSKPIEYEWRAWTDDMGVSWRRLLPIDEPNNYSMRGIASICQRGAIYIGSYYYPNSTGNFSRNWIAAVTAIRAMRYLERELMKFWDPPTIRNARIR